MIGQERSNDGVSVKNERGRLLVVREECSGVIFTNCGHQLQNVADFGGDLKFDIHEEMFKRRNALVNCSERRMVDVVKKKGPEKFGRFLRFKVALIYKRESTRDVFRVHVNGDVQAARVVRNGIED